MVISWTLYIEGQRYDTSPLKKCEQNFIEKMKKITKYDSR